MWAQYEIESLLSSIGVCFGLLFASQSGAEALEAGGLGGLFSTREDTGRDRALELVLLLGFPSSLVFNLPFRLAIGFRGVQGRRTQEIYKSGPKYCPNLWAGP